MIPPNLEEIVANAKHIGTVRILAAEVDEPVDQDGVVMCPSVYKAEWKDSLTGDEGEVRFASFQDFALNGVVLVFLSDEKLPRKLVSTNSLSEGLRQAEAKRREACTLSSQLLFTTPGTSARFVDGGLLPDKRKTGVWIEYQPFIHDGLKVSKIMPESFDIDGEVISKDTFITGFFREGKYGFVESAGHELLRYEAVNWAEYRARLIELIGNRNSTESLSERP